MLGSIISIGASLLGARKKKKEKSRAVKRAHAANVEGQKKAKEALTGQADKAMEIYKKYSDLGDAARKQQADLIGLYGAEPQERAINALIQSPYFETMQREQEESILRNASATGGLRGSGVQRMLAQTQPILINDLIQKQLMRLALHGSVGSTADVNRAGIQSSLGASLANVEMNKGLAGAGKHLALGQNRVDYVGDLMGVAGEIGKLAEQSIGAATGKFF